MDADALFVLPDEPAAPPRPPAGSTAPSGIGHIGGIDPVGPDAPLAVRMRPQSIEELVGQDKLLAPGAPLRRLVEPRTGEAGAGPGSLPSVILWGPPGTGKTTIAHLVARAANRRFVALSALTAGVKDVRAVIDEARRVRRTGGEATVLFIDEVHRFSKTQQDSLLGAVEDGTVTLLAATTENPYFSVISPLLSRCVLLTLQPLDDEAVRTLVRRALVDPRGLGGSVTLAPDAEDHIVRLAGGDVRKALTALEAAAAGAVAQGATEIDLSIAEAALDRTALRYDRDGDQHYDVVSAFIKSLRGSDVDAALHYLARMLVAGEDPRFIARRMVIFASEDVGMADPTALLAATAAAQAVEYVGLPEARLNLAQAAIHLATAPKSNAVIVAIDEAMADVRAGRGGPIPRHLRDAHYPGARGLGHGEGYRYPHDDPRGVVPQRYAPDDVADREYYRPTGHGAERALQERVARLRTVIRSSNTTSASPRADQPTVSGRAGHSGSTASPRADHSGSAASGRAERAGTPVSEG
jgi:putative ATPase